ncbi:MULTISPECIES: caspase family protein [Nostoc]|uniref:Caspase family protein n=2 Tax=Nostoc TaxID=1177 RepID=A0ABR8I6Z9_9NOSO|nr:MULTISPECIES: caspase family protein [Nostoc]MBD2559241.1 caspase family protein [Nostoc linckia FACHB-391]MBD2647392.1 caspase family protein [Nostoc foliaceum FACHB-393]
MAKVALLIGVSEYEPSLTPLPAAAKDVEAIQRVLLHPEIGGFDDVTLLINPPQHQMAVAIETLFDGRQRDDLVLLFFSGHSIKDESGKLYFAARNTRKTDKGVTVKATTVPANFVHEVMSNSRSKREVVILDCCFSGAFAEGMAAKDDGFVDIRNQLGGEGRAVLTSSTSIQYSFEQQGADTSTYTRYIVEGLETGAADKNEDGWISVDELHEYATKAVQEATSAMKPEIYVAKEGFKIRLAKAPIGDQKLKYRKEVELFASRGAISDIGRSTLDLKQQSLGLLPEEATGIEVEVLKPYQEYQKRLQKYEQVLVAEIQKQYPFSYDTYNELKVFQKALELKDKDIEPILARVAPQPGQVWSKILKTIEKQNYSTRGQVKPDLVMNASEVKKLQLSTVPLFATILALTGMIYGISSLSTKLNRYTPEPSPSSSGQSISITPEPSPSLSEQLSTKATTEKQRQDAQSEVRRRQLNADIRAREQRQLAAEDAQSEVRRRQLDADIRAREQR